MRTSSMVWNRWLKRLAPLAVLAWLLLTSADARAGDEEEIGVGIAIGGLAAVDLSFTVRAALLAANEQDAEFGYSLAQTIATSPQAVAANIAIVALMHDGDGDEIFMALHLPAIMVNALAAHGMWSLAVPDQNQATMFLASTLIGVNTTFTSFAVGSATTDRRHWGGDYEIPGIYMALLNAPGVAIGTHQALETSSFTAGWWAITGWSAANVLYGTIYAFGAFEDDYGDRYGNTRESHNPLANVSVAPASFGSPVEGAPETPGVTLQGVF